MNIALVGYPLGHSFSKSYFEKKFSVENIDASFINIEVADINDIRSICNDINDLRGFSVTIPHKKNIINFIDNIDPIAASIGAVNCVKVNKDGSWQGFNTDYVGFNESLSYLLRPHHDKALILGNGGAAAAVKYSLVSLNIPYLIVGRSADKCDIVYDQLDKGIISSHPLIINTTPMGTYPNTEVCPDIPYQHLSDQHLLYDLVYNPSETLFIKNGKKQGAITTNGYRMLELQAEAAWKLWIEE